MKNILLKELQGRVPSLDGLRAISILMVIASHAQITCGIPSVSWLPESIWWLFHGDLGVRIFFVISGFIITLLLLKEEAKTGSISISDFYKRRAIRILPPYLSLIVAVLIVDYAFSLNITRNIYIAAFTFTTGWWKDSTWLLGHTWSLSVEEQFYLLWPLTMILAKEKKTRYWLLAAGMLIFPLVRVAVYVSPLVEQRAYIIITQGDALIAGCGLAMILFYEGERIARWMTSYVVISRVICLALIFVTSGLQSNAVAGKFTVPMANFIDSLAIAWFVGTVVLNRGPFYNILNSRPFVFVGTVSYSWYLWQQLFLVPCGRYDQFDGFSFPVNIVLSFGAGVASYYLIERTSRKLRDA